MLDGVLFDFGGVIVDSPFDAFAEVEQRCGASAGTVRRINSADPDTNAWARFERGDVDAGQFVELFAREAAALGAPLDAQQLLDALIALPSARSDARPVMLDAVDRLRAAGIGVALLTNNVAPLDQRADTRWVYEAFDVVIESCRVGMRKPEPDIFTLACEALGVAPERTAVLDDLGINLKPARALGLQTIKVVDADVAVAELDALVEQD